MSFYWNFQINYVASAVFFWFLLNSFLNYSFFSPYCWVVERNKNCEANGPYNGHQLLWGDWQIFSRQAVGKFYWRVGWEKRGNHELHNVFFLGEGLGRKDENMNKERKLTRGTLSMYVFGVCWRRDKSVLESRR